MWGTGRSGGPPLCIPGEQLHIGVALDQHEAAPVPKQGSQGGVRDPALHSAVAPIAAGGVQVLGDGAGRAGWAEVRPHGPKCGGQTKTAIALCQVLSEDVGVGNWERLGSVIFPWLRGVRACLLSPSHPPGPPAHSRYPRVMLQDDHQPMHVQPALPGVGIHGQHRLPVGCKLGVGGVGPTVLK